MSDERLAFLEERLAWLQRHVTEQDKAMLEMAGEIDQLKKSLSELSEKTEPDAGPTTVIDERPPHY
jgi:SlyX protein